MIGNSLTHYPIPAKLGEGGMGEVYRASDTRLGREVASKVLPARISRDAQSLARFEREAKALAALNHPHIAPAFTVSTRNEKLNSSCWNSSKDEPEGSKRSNRPVNEAS